MTNNQIIMLEMATRKHNRRPAHISDVEKFRVQSKERRTRN